MAEEGKSQRATLPTAQITSSIRGLSRSSYALEHAGKRYPLPFGETVIGRGDEADIVLDGPLISRRHARVTVTEAAVFVEDLGSVNGVAVDGRPIKVKTPVAAGARVFVAQTPLTLIRTDAARAGRDTTRIPSSGDPPTGGRPDSGAQVRGSAETDEARRAQAFKLVAGVVEKALAMGQPEEAERISGGMLQDVLREAQRTTRVPRDIAEAAAQAALKLANATGRSPWIDYPVQLYDALGRMLPLSIIDAMYAVGRRGRVDVELLKRYAVKMSALSLAPAERFALQRLNSW